MNGRFLKEEEPEKEQKIQRPIASLDPADLEANLYLDDLVGAGGVVRNQGMHVSVEKPEEEAIFKLGEASANLEFIAEVVANELPQNYKFLLRIFDNKEDSYINDEPLWQGLMASNQVGNENGRLSLSARTSLPSRTGLYYYMIVLESEMEPLIVHRFKVMP